MLLRVRFDVDADVPGVTTGALRAELTVIGKPTTVDGHNMAGDDFAVTAARRGSAKATSDCHTQP